MRTKKLGLEPLFVRLYKLDQTEHLWIFAFRDPVHHFHQSIIVNKEASWESLAGLWDKLHQGFRDALRER